MAGKVEIKLDAANALRIVALLHSMEPVCQCEHYTRLREAHEEFISQVSLNITDAQITDAARDIDIQNALGYDAFSRS